MGIKQNPLCITNRDGAVLSIERQPEADGQWLFSLTSASGQLIGNGSLADIMAVMRTIAGHCGGKVADGASQPPSRSVEETADVLRRASILKDGGMIEALWSQELEDRLHFLCDDRDERLFWGDNNRGDVRWKIQLVETLP